MSIRESPIGADMANLRTTLAHVGASDRQGNVIPPHVFARKLQERTERQKRAGSTILAQATEQEEAAS